MLKDPVCGMIVDDKSAHKSTHEGQTYVFSSPTCKAKFDEEPKRYAASDEAEVPLEKET